MRRGGRTGGQRAEEEGEGRQTLSGGLGYKYEGIVTMLIIRIVDAWRLENERA